MGWSRASYSLGSSVAKERSASSVLYACSPMRCARGEKISSVLSKGEAHKYTCE